MYDSVEMHRKIIDIGNESAISDNYFPNSAVFDDDIIFMDEKRNYDLT